MTTTRKLLLPLTIVLLFLPGLLAVVPPVLAVLGCLPWQTWTTVGGLCLVLAPDVIEGRRREWEDVSRAGTRPECAR